MIERNRMQHESSSSKIARTGMEENNVDTDSDHVGGRVQKKTSGICFSRHS